MTTEHAVGGLRLLESQKPAHKGGVGGTLASVILHGVLIAGAVALTAKAGIEKVQEHREQHVLYVAPPPKPIEKPMEPVVKKPEPPKPAPKSPKAPPKVVAPVVPQVRVVATPAIVPTTIPPVTVPLAQVNKGDFEATTKPVAPPVAQATQGLGSGSASTGPYTEFTVDVPVQIKDARTPEYPENLREAGVTGHVMVRFIVDEKGRVEKNSFEILESSDSRFNDVVRRAVFATRYAPARAHGEAVRQLVEQPFDFRIQSGG